MNLNKRIIINRFHFCQTLNFYAAIRVNCTTCFASERCCCVHESNLDSRQVRPKQYRHRTGGKIWLWLLFFKLSVHGRVFLWNRCATRDDSVGISYFHWAWKSLYIWSMGHTLQNSQNCRINPRVVLEERIRYFFFLTYLCVVTYDFQYKILVKYNLWLKAKSHSIPCLKKKCLH